MIADPTGGWMKSFPEDHNKYVNQVNTKHNGGAKKLARHLKVWKYKRNVPVSSCYLEMQAAKYLSDDDSYHSVLGLYYVLNHLKTAQLAAMNDPAGLGSRFGACSSESNKEDALSKLDTAVSRARKAKDYYLADDHQSAIEQLKLLFNQ